MDRIISSAGLVIIILLSLFTACTTEGEYSFVPVGKKSADGCYDFSVDMSDTSSLYTLGFYSRIDCNEGEWAEMGDIPMEITLVSPAGKTYHETAVLPKDKFADGAFPSREFVADYRKETKPVENGTWKFSVRVGNDESIKGFRGLGVYVKKMPYGKR